MSIDLNPQTASLEDWRECVGDGAAIARLARTAPDDGLVIKALYTAADLPQVLPENLGHEGRRVIAAQVEPQNNAGTLTRAIAEEIAGGAGYVIIPAACDPAIIAPALADTDLGKARIGFAPRSPIRKIADALGGAGGFDKTAIHLAADPALYCLDGGTGEAAHAMMGFLLDDNATNHTRGFAVAGDEYNLLGLNDIDENAAICAATVFILRGGEAHGASAADIFNAMEWRFAVGTEIYRGIAKTRALAMNLMQIAARIGGDSEKITARMHGITSLRAFTRAEAETNILRGGGGMLASMLGGAGMITVRPYDWPTGSTPRARRLARQMVHIAAHEARLDAVADAASGSYYMESLTDTLARKAWARFRAIEKAGGMGAAKAVKKIRAWGAEAAAAREAAVNSGAMPLLGATIHAASGGDMHAIIDNRGGGFRHAAGWEALRENAARKNHRCLLLDIEGGGKKQKATAASAARWFHAAGLTATAITAANLDEAKKSVKAAKPDILVVAGIDTPQVFSNIIKTPCRMIDADAFANRVDKKKLMTELMEQKHAAT